MEVLAHAPDHRQQIQARPHVPRSIDLCLTGALTAIWFWAALARGRQLGYVLQGLVLVTGFLLFMVGRARLQRRLIRKSPDLAERATKTAERACFLFLVFLPEYFLGKPVPVVRSLIFLVVVALLFVALGQLRIENRQPVDGAQTERRVRRWLGAFGAGYFAVTSILTVWKLNAFGYVGQDIAYFAQCLYTTLHGHLFYSNMYHDLFYSKAVTTDFAAHNQPVLFLFLPFYALAKSPATMLLVRNLFVVLCAWPMYLIVRRITGARTAAWAAVAFLLSPAVIYQNIYDFAPLSVAGFPLLFAFYYFLEKRLAPFLLWLLATQLVREDLVFVTLGLAGLALWQRRGWKWIALPGVFGVFWAWLSWMVLFPHFLHGATSVVNTCFAQLGSTPAQMGMTVLHHPLAILGRENAIYLKQLLEPLGLILFLGNPAFLLAAPYTLLNLMGQGGACNTAIVYRHYSLIPFVLLFVSFVLTLEAVRRRSPAGERDFAIPALVRFVLASAVLSLVFVTGHDVFAGFRQQPWADEANRVAAMLPADAAVAVPRYMLPRLASRERLYQSLRLLEYAKPDPDYVVIDKDWERMAASERWRPEYERLCSMLASSSSFTPIYDSSNYLVYHKCPNCRAQLTGPAGRSGE